MKRISAAASVLVFVAAVFMLLRCSVQRPPFDMSDRVDDEGYPVVVKPEDDIGLGDFSCDAVRYYEIPDFSQLAIFAGQVDTDLGGFSIFTQRDYDILSHFARAYFYDFGSRSYLRREIVDGRFTDDIAIVSEQEALSENHVFLRHVRRKYGFFRMIPSYIYFYSDIYLDHGEHSYRYSSRPSAIWSTFYSFASSTADFKGQWAYRGWRTWKSCWRPETPRQYLRSINRRTSDHR